MPHKKDKENKSYRRKYKYESKKYVDYFFNNSFNNRYYNRYYMSNELISFMPEENINVDSSDVSGAVEVVGFLGSKILGTLIIFISIAIDIIIWLIYFIINMIIKLVKKQRNKEQQIN